MKRAAAALLTQIALSLTAPSLAAPSLAAQPAPAAPAPLRLATLYHPPSSQAQARLEQILARSPNIQLVEPARQLAAVQPLGLDLQALAATPEAAALAQAAPQLASALEAMGAEALLMIWTQPGQVRGWIVGPDGRAHPVQADLDGQDALTLSQGRALLRSAFDQVAPHVLAARAPEQRRQTAREGWSQEEDEASMSASTAASPSDSPGLQAQTTPSTARPAAPSLLVRVAYLSGVTTLDTQDVQGLDSPQSSAGVAGGLLQLHAWNKLGLASVGGKLHASYLTPLQADAPGAAPSTLQIDLLAAARLPLPLVTAELGVGPTWHAHTTRRAAAPQLVALERFSLRADLHLRMQPPGWIIWPEGSISAMTLLTGVYGQEHTLTRGVTYEATLGARIMLGEHLSVELGGRVERAQAQATPRPSPLGFQRAGQLTLHQLNLHVGLGASF